MQLTQDYKGRVRARIERDSRFRKTLFEEGAQCLLAGDVYVGKSVLRDYIEATIGFDELGKIANKSPKSLIRMLGPHGNLRARDLCQIIGLLQKREGMRLKVRAVR